MKRHIFITLLLTLTVILSQAQQTDFIQIKAPIVDTTLTLSFAKFVAPLYIINSNYVVFQGNDNKRKVLNVDVNSFKVIVNNPIRETFALDKNGVYFLESFIKTDTTGFKIVGEIKYMTDYIWKTKDKVFLNTTEITGDIDVPSFKKAGSMNRPYYKDKNYIYYKGEKIKGSDGSSASESSENIIYDKNYVYIDGKIALYNGDTIRPVNQVLAKTEKDVLGLSREGRHIVQPYMDAKTIKYLSRYYSMDKNFVYYGSKQIPILPENFDNVKVWDAINHAYISDEINVYDAKWDIIQSDLDAKTFGVIPLSDFFFDKNGIYKKEWDSEKEEAIIVKLPFSYTKDISEKNAFMSKIYRYLIYDNQAYDVSEKKMYRNLSQEQINLAKDNKDIESVNGKIIKKNQFDYLLYEVNNEIHWNGKKTIADASTFKRIQTFEYYLDFFKDRRNVYIYDRDKGLIPVRGIDVQTATTNKHNFLSDKDYIYANNIRIIKNNNLEVLAIFEGYKAWCGLDETPSSDYYLFKNSEGYWLALISNGNGVRIRYLGNKLSENTKKILSGE